ncbi:MAG TPA: alpha/beta hydrolase [Cellvibrionaceae bacterium]
MGCVSYGQNDQEEGEVIALYSGSIPGGKVTDDWEKVRDPAHPDTFLQQVTFPNLTVYMAATENAMGTAVIIAPGGGYGGVSVVKEGEQVARRFNELGITAFVLKYRDPMDITMENKKFGPLQDAQRALYWVRQNAEQWQLDPERIGIMGFSAGGHLASSAAVHYPRPVLEEWTPDQVRPDFHILIYPVISFNANITHRGSRRNLLGEAPAAQWLSYFSNESQVTSDTPPAFIVHAGDDEAVPVKNSLVYYQALQAAGVESGLLILPNGGHGFGLRNPIDWFATLEQWLYAQNLAVAPSP